MLCICTANVKEVVRAMRWFVIERWADGVQADGRVQKFNRLAESGLLNISRDELGNLRATLTKPTSMTGPEHILAPCTKPKLLPWIRAAGASERASEAPCAIRNAPATLPNLQ